MSTQNVDATIQQLAVGFEAAVSFAELCRFLSDDRLRSEATQVSASAQALFKAAMYDLMASDRGKPARPGA